MATPLCIGSTTPPRFIPKTVRPFCRHPPVKSGTSSISEEGIMNDIDVIRSVNFDWAMRISDVWSDSAWDTPELHANVRSEFARKLEIMCANKTGGSPLGWIIVGSGGTGKTHLLGSFRREATRRKAAFVLVDMTDVRNFWESVLQGYIDSLQQSFDGEMLQYECVLRNIIERSDRTSPSRRFSRRWLNGRARTCRATSIKSLLP